MQDKDTITAAEIVRQAMDLAAPDRLPGEGPLTAMLRQVDELDPMHPRNLRRHMLQPGPDGKIYWTRPVPFQPRDPKP